MRGDQRKRVAAQRNLHLRKPAAHVQPPAVEQEAFVVMPRDFLERETAQVRDVNRRVER